MPMQSQKKFRGRSPIGRGRSRRAIGSRIPRRRVGEIAASVERIEKLLAPPPNRPWYRRAVAWVGAGLLGVLAGAVFALPDELRVTHIFALRQLQERLGHYETFVPDRCAEALPSYRELRLQVDRTAIEFAIISRNIGRCLQNGPADGDIYARLDEARSMYEDAFRAFENYEPSIGRRIAVLLGARRPYSRGEHIEVGLRLAEVERRLAFFGESKRLLRRAKERLIKVIALSSGNPLLAGVASNNLGNVVNHLFLVRTPPDPIAITIGIASEDKAPALLEQALRLYSQAVALLEGSSELRARAQVNLGLQQLAIAIAYSPPLGWMSRGDTTGRDRVAASLKAAQDLFSGIVHSEPGDPLDRLVQPNFALTLGTAFATVGSAGSISPLAPSELLGLPESSQGPRGEAEPNALGALRAAEAGFKSSRSGVLFFSNEQNLRDSLYWFANAIDHLADSGNVAEGLPPRLPFEYRAALVGRGIAGVELGMVAGDAMALREGIESLRQSLELVNLSGTALVLDVKSGLGPHIAPTRLARAGSSQRLEALAMVNLWRACLFRAAFEDTEQMLALGDLLAAYLSSEAYSWARELDPVLVQQIAAVQVAVRWHYRTRPTDPSSLGPAFYAITEARMSLTQGNHLPGGIIWRF